MFPGDYISEQDGLIRGHGTSTIQNVITSTYFGEVKQINKLVTVEPYFSFKYRAEVGDIVIGRVTDIHNKKWMLWTNSRSETSLSLSAINLPGVLQRRKSEEDEMNMRNFFDVNDLVVCEVQKVGRSGSAALHTRNEKYRKLENGMLIVSEPFLIEAMKSRFVEKDDVGVIVGCNGFVWIYVMNESDRAYSRICWLYSRLKQMISLSCKINVEKVLNEMIFEII